MRFSIIALSGTEAAPYLIRIAALIVALLSVIDFMRRRTARRFMESLRTAGANAPQNAVSLADLESVCPHITLLHRLLLGNGAVLGQAVASVTPDGAAHLGGRGRDLLWYIPAVSETESENSDGACNAERRVPSVLRNGGEKKIPVLVAGIALTFIAAELLVYFFPQIVSMLTYLSDVIG